MEEKTVTFVMPKCDTALNPEPVPAHAAGSPLTKELKILVVGKCDFQIGLQAPVQCETVTNP